MLKGKTVLLGVSGSIAAYKIAGLARLLVKEGASVHVLMTKNAAQFINPITFETLTAHKCLMDTFDRNFKFSVEHVALAKRADIFMLAPATANVIAKAAHGLADDMLTTTLLACRCPKIIAPAMNTAMLENPATQENLETCRRHGMTVIAPATGRLANGDTGAGKMPEPETLFEWIDFAIGREKDLAGKKILVTAGPTREALDPVRYLTNHSSGKMGFALAKVAAARGADVTLVSGPVALKTPLGVKRVDVTSAREMFEAVTERSAEQDIIIMAAAVADYRPKSYSEQKIKKSEGGMSLALERTDDILAWLGEHKKPGLFLCGFCMETQSLVQSAREKLARKNADLICANSLAEEGAGFGGDTNIITLVSKTGERVLPLQSKEDAAAAILDEIKQAGLTVAGNS